MAKPRQTQDPPKSLRLQPDDLAKSQQIAGLLGITWHRWINKLVGWGNALPPDQIKSIAESNDQEKVE